MSATAYTEGMRALQEQADSRLPLSPDPQDSGLALVPDPQDSFTNLTSEDQIGIFKVGTVLIYI